MGRAPCCDKTTVKRGPWSPDEDSKLKSYMQEHGTGGNWIALPHKIGLKRCGKSCRLRWLNYLRPNIRHGSFSEEEDNVICSLYLSIGSRWSIIAAQLPGRTDNDIKNYWNTRLKKKLMGMQRKEQQSRRAMKEEISAVENNPAQNQLDNNPNFMDQESITNLLINLGGRFSENHHQIHQEQMYASMFSSPATMNSTDSTAATTNYSVNEGDQMMVQGIENFPIELDGYVYGNTTGLGLEGLYGMDQISNVGNTGTSSNSGESMSSCLIYEQQPFAEYETNWLHQDSPFEDSSNNHYFWLQR